MSTIPRAGSGRRDASATRFLDPAVLAGIDDLQLLARQVVEGFLAGRHLDLRPGPGVEFSQYRPYLPGDDLRRVDWRVYGRSDRLMIRDADVERDVTVRIVLDCSRSMLHAEPHGAPPQSAGTSDGESFRPTTKLDYARMLAASFAFLAERQGDRIALLAPAGEIVGETAGRARRTANPVPQVEPSHGGQDLVRVCALLARIEAAGRWPAWSQLGPLLAPSTPGGAGGGTSGRGARDRQLIVWISDLYEHDDEMIDTLRALRAARHEVLVIQLMGRSELELGWQGDLMFEDLETGKTVRADAESLRPAYRQRMSAYLDGWRRRVRDLGADYHLMVTDEPLDRGLRALLLRRQALP